MVEEWSRVKEKQHGQAAALCRGGGDVGGGRSRSKKGGRMVKSVRKATRPSSSFV